MKILFLLVIGILTMSCDRNENLPDPVDRNITPSGLEEREEEFINQSDPVDENFVPAQEEEREREEESIYEGEEVYE
ncbi:MAG: hypothetical protein ACLGHN_14215 [Bacteriovoracia bacterium]